MDAGAAQIDFVAGYPEFAVGLRDALPWLCIGNCRVVRGRTCRRRFAGLVTMRTFVPMPNGSATEHQVATATRPAGAAGTVAIKTANEAIRCRQKCGVANPVW
jgi:hypothetical protein